MLSYICTTYKDNHKIPFGLRIHRPPRFFKKRSRQLSHIIILQNTIVTDKHGRKCAPTAPKGAVGLNFYNIKVIWKSLTLRDVKYRTHIFLHEMCHIASREVHVLLSLSRRKVFVESQVRSFPFRPFF